MVSVPVATPSKVTNKNSTTCNDKSERLPDIPSLQLPGMSG
jgi:hypothetical protein